MNEMGIQLVTNHSIFMAKAMSQFWLGHGLLLFHLSLEKKALSHPLKGLEKNWTKDQPGGHDA